MERQLTASETKTNNTRSKRHSSSLSEATQIDNKPKRIHIQNFCKWMDEPIPIEEAKRRWPHRYQNNTPNLKIARHYRQVLVDNEIYSLNDDAIMKAKSGMKNCIGKMIEFFESIHGVMYFTAQLYYHASETVIKQCGNLISDRCVFFSDEMTEEKLFNCIVEKAIITNLPFKADEKEIPLNHFYCDMRYSIPYSSFVSFKAESTTKSNESCSTVSSVSSGVDAAVESPGVDAISSEKTVLDLYAGCGAMSTGLCMGANGCDVNLVTKWAIDINEHACESLRLNHPETQVRHENAEDFLNLLKEWDKLCSSDSEIIVPESNICTDESNDCKGKENDESDSENELDEYEVEEILNICYGDPNKTGKHALHFRIHWKGYGPEDDTWEPQECLISCEEKLKDFVSLGLKSKFLPLPGTVDVICGGPPCQGISGFNRFRDKNNPLGGNKNNQLLVFMEIVNFLKPKFVLMENVVDLLKFSEGFVGRYALGSLVAMGYQARLGIMTAGKYGLPQYRMRVFLWGALPTERLPQYPLPTHKAEKRGVSPLEFEANVVDARHNVQLKEALCLEDAISDLPCVSNKGKGDEIPYEVEAKTEFQRFIRLRRDEMPGCLKFNGEIVEHLLYDHLPLCLNQDDYERVCQIPKKKGANFRNLPGVIVGENNIVEFDPKVERHKVSSGKPLVPNYAMSFVGGISSKPFGRLWWDETVPTVVGRAEPHNQKILHPSQDRVLTIRENARLQGFPDFYKLVGPTKQRYIQVGNAVAVPVARALGVSLAMALRGLSSDQPVFTLPEGYPNKIDVQSIVNNL